MRGRGKEGGRERVARELHVAGGVGEISGVTATPKTKQFSFSHTER